MSKITTVESITGRPPAGLNLLEWSIIGLTTAREKVVEVYPTLARKCSTGLSLLELANLGLQSAIEKIQTETGQ